MDSRIRFTKSSKREFCALRKKVAGRQAGLIFAAWATSYRAGGADVPVIVGKRTDGWIATDGVSARWGHTRKHAVHNLKCAAKTRRAIESGERERERAWLKRAVGLPVVVAFIEHRAAQHGTLARKRTGYDMLREEEKSVALIALAEQIRNGALTEWADKRLREVRR